MLRMTYKYFQRNNCSFHFVNKKYNLLYPYIKEKNKYEKSHTRFLAVASIISSNSANADWVEVICTTSNGLERLMNTNGNPETISGRRVTDTNLMGRTVHYFSVSQSDHDQVKALCSASGSGSQPLPGYSVDGRLAFFKVNFPDGGYSFEPRHFNEQRMRDYNHYFRSL